jgi:hypothetical protein
MRRRSTSDPKNSASSVRHEPQPQTLFLSFRGRSVVIVTLVEQLQTVWHLPSVLGHPCDQPQYNG